MRARSGLTLLEAIVALSILATAGIAAVNLTSESTHTVSLVRNTDRDIARASELLDAVTLWSVDDLDRHLGTRSQGDWRMRVNKDGPLYRVAVTDSAGRTLLETSLYRPSVSRGLRE